MESGDIAWVLASAALVLFMTPGLALFYGGMDRSRSVLNMMLMNFWCLLSIPVLWVIIGYSFAQGDAGNGVFGGFGSAFLNGMDIATDNGEALLGVVFLGMFAVITPALISGAVSSRMKFTAWAIFAPVWMLLVFAPIFKWVYGGWLGERGSLDFAGGTAIHVNAGMAALVAAIMLGKRSGWPQKLGKPHNMPLVMLGTGILWFGWFGFNAGSAFGANGQAIQAFMNTFVAAAASGLSWLLIERFRDGRTTSLGAASGIVAGLVAITPAAGYVTTFPSLVIGLITGVLCYFAVQLKYRAGFDDALDVVGVHFVGGLVGSVLIGFFADPVYFGADHMAGLFYGGGLALLGEQILANVVAIAYCGVMTALILFVMKKTIGIRVEEHAETTGIDHVEHAEVAYSLDRPQVPSRNGVDTPAPDLVGVNHS